ncbi:MAG: hypothetical protein J0I47_08475 [Sphingomonas sp.]|uniref:hypothetical protein n=1 Tax=Sphingomonas sp. TaxID=28214 RepID=UPI001AC07860|nr:hypothetical protein [Sphingomonas sp.]MBN8808258.1 hypothetical protein [Sphingomonas sp.]
MSTIYTFADSGGQRSATSRRTLLSSLAAVSIGSVAGGAPMSGAQTYGLFGRSSDQPITLERSFEGRRLSRFRYHNAESFFRSCGERAGPLADTLYRTGIVMQLGLSSHLLDVGFADQWCARNLGLFIEKSLTLANATGLGFHSTDLATLAAALSPYSKWRNAGMREVDPNFAFALDDIQPLVRSLLDRVRDVTGHARPAVRRR